MLSKQKNAILRKPVLNSFVLKFVLLVLLSFNYSAKAYCGSWNVVWQEDFGVVEDSVCRDFADPNMSVPGHKLADVDQMQDGYYGIINSTYWAYIRKTSVNSDWAYWFVPGRDHTGNNNGGMLVVNVGGKGNGENIYENDLSINVCGDHKYKLTMYVANVSNATLSPNLTLQIYNVKDNANPKLLKSVNVSGNDVVRWPGKYKNQEGLYIHDERDWTETSLEFEADESDLLKIVITNNCSSGNGNDFAIDDITLERYDDDEVVRPDIEFSKSLTKSTCIPTYAVNNTDLLTSWKTLYPKIYFLWQYSTDEGYTWTNLTKESGIEKTYLQREVPSTGKEVYRAIITGGETESEAKNKATYIGEHETPENGCDYFSISNIISQVDRKPKTPAYVGIDKNKSKTNEPVYDCEDETHSVDLIATGWDALYRSYSVLWQYSSDDATWTNMTTTDKKFDFSDEFEGKTYFRAIVAEDDESLQQVVANGVPDDCEKDFYITNSVSLECDAKCEIPIFEPIANKVMLCEDRNDALEWRVRQTNNAMVSEMEWYSKAEGEKKWTLIAGETKMNITVANPKKSTSYLFVGKHKKCVSDSILFEFIVNPSIKIGPISDTKICQGDDVEYTAKVLSGKPTKFIWDFKTTNSANFIDKNVQVSKTMTLYATDDVCTSAEVTAYIDVEERVDVTLEAVPEAICEGETVEINASANLDPINKYGWLKDGKPVGSTGLTLNDTPSKDASYKFFVEGVLCPRVEKDIDVKVEKKIEDFNLVASSESVCEGESVTVKFDANVPSSYKIQWDKNNVALNSTDKSITDIPDADATYNLTITGEICSKIEKSVDVTVETKPEFELKINKDSFCETADVELTVLSSNLSNYVLMTKYEGENDFTETKNANLSFTSDKSATYKIASADNKVCERVYSNEVSLIVEQPIDVTFEDIPDLVCEGASVKLSATISSENGTYGWKKDGDKSFAENKLNVDDTPAGLTKYEFWVDNSICPDFSKPFNVDVEPSQKIELTASQTTLCQNEDVTLSTNYSYEKGIVWESKGKNDTQFTEITTGKLSIVDSPIENTTYRVSAVSENGCKEISDERTISVVEPIDLKVKNSSSACGGGLTSFFISTKNPVDKIIWIADNDTVEIKENYYNIDLYTTTNYTVIATKEHCEERKEGTIEVNEPPHILSYEQISENSYQMIVDDDSEPLYFIYQNGEEPTTSNVIENVKMGRLYKIVVMNEKGCSSTFEFMIPFAGLEFPKYFYQGEENWKVKNLDYFLEPTLKIYDRYGKLLYTETGTTEGWEGVYNGYVLPTTDYWYVLDVPEIDKQYTGHFTLLRR